MAAGLSPDDHSSDVRAAWHARAAELARWARDRYFVRDDVWGGYIPLAKRDQLGATCTRPAVAKRGQVRLTLAVLERHFRATRPEHVVGAHTTSLDNVSLLGTVEVDKHGDGGNDPAANWRAARGWWEQLCSQGFRPLLWDSNGKGGYHLDVLFRSPIPTALLYWFLRRLVRDHRTFGLPAAPECFPKQERLCPTEDGRGRCGNWVRLPGRHHTHEHWAKVWDGGRWLKGAAAVDYLLSLVGDPADLVPDLPPPSRPTRRCQPHVSGRDGNLSACIARYLGRLPNLGEGQGRDGVAFRFAAFLVRDMALADDIALEWLCRWDAGNSPPKGEAVLREILANAHRHGRNPYGCGRSSQGPRRDRHGHIILTSRVEIS
jgi:hypothetical protein